MLRVLLLLATLATAPLAACSSGSATSDGSAATDGGGAADGGAGSDLGASGCRVPGPADAPRKVLVSLPFDAQGKKSDRVQVLDLAADGSLSKGPVIRLTRAFSGEMQFTPDGALGFLAGTDDGTLGVVRVKDGVVEVVEAAKKLPYGAHVLKMDPSGERLWILSTGFRNVGGGIYSLRIGCDGTLTDEGLRAEAKLAYRMELTADGTRAVVPATDVANSAAGTVHLVDPTGGSPTVVGSVEPWEGLPAIVGGGALTPDGRFALFGDINETEGTNDRVAVVELTSGGLVARQLLSPIEDPQAIVASPFGNAALVTSGYGDAIVALDYAPAAATPFTVRGPLAYQGGKPLLPGSAVLVARGALKGLVLVAEVEGVRRVRFNANGSVTDLGVFALGENTGAVGVQP